jgi:hypothetical protein
MSISRVSPLDFGETAARRSFPLSKLANVAYWRNPQSEALKHRVPNIHALGTRRLQMLDELGRKLSSHSTMMMMRTDPVTVPGLRMA